MKIAPDILGRHLEAAAQEQLARELGEKGYTVERQTSDGDLFRPDLVARRGDETIVYEIKVPGSSTANTMRRAAAYARDHGAGFRLVLVRSPREATIEFDGLDGILLDALRDPLHTDFDVLSSRTLVESVDNVELDAIHVVGDGSSVLNGSGTVSVALTAEQGRHEFAQQAFSFSFSLHLDARRRVIGDTELVVDTSAWYDGEDDSSPNDDTDQ